MGDFEVVRVAVTALTHEQLKTGRQNRDALTHLEAHNPHLGVGTVQTRENAYLQ